MPSKAEVLAKISAALNQKTGGQKPCVICGQINKWTILDSYSVPILGLDPGGPHFFGASLPLVPLVCTNCGNTHFINLRILGFTDMSLLKIDDDAITPR